MSREATSAVHQFASDKAAVELLDKAHTTRRVIQKLKIAQRDRLAELARLAGVWEPEILAGAPNLFLEGARVMLQSVGAEGFKCAAHAHRRSDDPGAYGGVGRVLVCSPGRVK